MTGDTLRQLLDISTVLVVNAHEARAAAAALGAAPAGPRDAARLLAGQGGAAVVATLGPEGAFAALPGGGEMQAASPAVAAVDTTGAGDTFVGVFAAGLAEDLPLQPAMERACRAAALACLKLGARSAMPHRAEISG